MKTQKEIEDRLEMHQARAGEIMKLLGEEQVKIFKNQGTIALLQKQLYEENCAIVHLSWTLI